MTRALFVIRCSRLYQPFMVSYSAPSHGARKLGLKDG